MSLKVQELAKNITIAIGKNRPLSMKFRLLLYVTGVTAGIFSLSLLPPLLYFSFLRDNQVFQSAIAVFFLTFPLVTINWLIKNFDTYQQLKYSLQQLKDSSKQLEDSSKQQDENLFSNSLQLLFKENDIIVKSIGLKELVKLKQKGKIDHERIDTITSSGLQIKKASLQGADLRETNLQGVNLQEANLQGVNLQEADLREANLQGVNLQGANLQRADIQRTDLREADLRGADLQGAFLQFSNLQRVNLQRVNLQRANLQRANLREAGLQDAKFEHSQYDEKTIFPNGFDPEQHEMRKVKLA